MAYRNALGKEVLHPMGVFRLSGKLELTCFVGAKVAGEAGVTVQYKPTETPAGATALLGAPTIEVGPSGNVGVKCDAFAGAQAGGALSGAFAWIGSTCYSLAMNKINSTDLLKAWQLTKVPIARPGWPGHPPMPGARNTCWSRHRTAVGLMVWRKRLAQIVRARL